MNKLLSSLIVIIIALLSSFSLFAATEQVRVNGDNNDAEERVSDADMYRDSSDLELGYDPYRGGTQIIGMRFQTVNVPQGATINSAYVEFEVDETDSGTTNLVVYGQDIDDAAQFGGGDGNISGRTKTSASVNWSPSAWSSSNQKQNTPDISSIIQEIVNRGGWADGNDMVVMIEPGAGCSSSSCQRTAEAYDGESSAAPLLVIDYTASSSYAVSSVHGACGTDNLLVVQFDNTIDSNALDVNYYALNAGSIDSVAQQDDQTVVLTISNVLPGQSYTLTAGGVGTTVDFSGLTGHYFDQRDGSNSKVSYNSGGLFTGNEYFRKDAQIGFNWGSGRPSVFPNTSGNNDRYSVRWNGYVVPAQSGDYEFRLYSDDGVRLDLSGTEIVNDWSLHGPRYSSTSATQSLSAGVGYPVQMEFFEHTGGAVAQMQWRRNGGSWEIVPTGFLSSCASSGNLAGLMNVDNQFQVYLSTDDSVQGTLVGSGNDWTVTESVSAGLIGTQDYYLHVYATDAGGVAGFLGEFNLTGTNYRFENGNTTLLTNSSDWRVSTSGWSNYQTATAYGTNGVSPWGTIAGVNAAAQWIWSSDNSGHNVNYFTTKLSISSSYSVTSVSGACGADNLLIVQYDSTIDSDALDLGYYSLNSGTISSVTQQDDQTVVLAISGVEAGNSYTLTVDGVDHAVDFSGLTGHYYDQRDGSNNKVSPLAGVFTGTEYLRNDSQLNFSWATGTPSIFPSVSGNNERFSVRWRGFVVPSQDGDYEFRMYSDDGMRVDFDGSQILTDWSNHAPRYSSASASQSLLADVGVPVEVEYFENTGQAYSQLQWRRNGGSWQAIPSANLSSCAVTAAAPTPVIEYRMDESSWSGATSEVVDSSGNNHHAAAQNDLTTDSDAHLCRAGSFDGVDDYISNAAVGSTLSGTSSLSFWIKTTQTGNNTGWQAPGIAGVEQSGGSDDIFWGWLDASGNIGLSVGNDYSSKSTVAVNDGNYHHVVLTRDANTGAYKIYIDGSLNQSGFIAAGVIGTSFSSIGRIEDTGGSPEYFQGLLDELKVFDQVLTDAQVTSIYGESRTCADLILDLRMEEGAWNGTAGEVIDSSASGYHGRAVNGATTNALSSALAGDPGTCRYGEFDDAGGLNGDYIELTTFPNLTSSFTMTSWIRTTDRGQAGQRILADDETNTQGYAISLGDPGAGRIRFYSRGVSPVSLDTPSIISNNTWYFVAAVADIANQQRTIYIFDQSGTLLSTTQGSYTGSWGVDAGTATVGGESNSGETSSRFRGNLDEVRVYNAALDQASIASILNQTHPCATTCTLSSFTLTSPANAIACPTTRAEVSIQANCSSGAAFEGTVDLSTNDATVGLSEFYENASGGSPVTSLTFAAADAGTKSAHLFYKNEKSDLTVTVDDQASSVTATTSAIPFSTQGFLVNRLDANPSLNVECGIAGSSGKRYSLTAYGQVQDGSGACAITSGFTGNKAFKSWFLVNYDPDEEASPTYDTANSPLLLSGANVVSGGSVSANSEPASSNLNLTFASGVSEFNIDYADAGQIGSVEFRHEHAVSSDTLSGAVPGFVSYPQAIEVTVPSAVACTSNFGNCATLTSAGSDFTMLAAAVCSDGSTAQSYETPTVGPATEISLTSSYVPSVSGDNGALNVTSLSFGDADNGQLSTNNQRISEVGVFRISTGVPAYFSQAIPSFDSAPIGRFTPARYEVSITSGDFAPQCSVGNDFTYMNQSFAWNNVPSVTIRALNAEDSVTANYEGDFWKLGASLQLDSDTTCAAASGGTRGFCYDDNTGLTGIALQSPNVAISYGDTSNVDGQVTLPMSHGGFANFIYNRTPGTNVIPFQANIDLDINISDGEGATGNGSLNGIAFSGSAELRQGRWKMENAFGPETQALRMKAYPEYFNAAGAFVRNADDLCSAVTVTTDPVPSGGNISVGASGNTTLTIASPLGDAQGENFIFSAPGATNTGNVGVSVSLTALPWLQFDWDGDGSLEDHPDVTAQFGQFRGHDRIIYWREVSN